MTRFEPITAAHFDQKYNNNKYSQKIDSTNALNRTAVDEIRTRHTLTSDTTERCTRRKFASTDMRWKVPWRLSAMLRELAEITPTNSSQNIMQIMIGIGVNSEAYFPKLREYCPSAEGTRAIFPQLREIITHYWSMMPVTICFVIPLIEMDTELEAIVNQVIKFKIP